MSKKNIEKEDICQKIIQQDLSFLTQKEADTKSKPNQIMLPQHTHHEQLQPTQL